MFAIRPTLSKKVYKMFDSENFWNATVSELKNGWRETLDGYLCLWCGEKFDREEIFKAGDRFYRARRAVALHVEQRHQGAFLALLNLDRKCTGLTPHQQELLLRFYRKESDEEIRRQMQIGSAVTVRHHRFAFRERERQAKVFLALMELLKEQGENPGAEPVDFPPGRQPFDDRYLVTREEKEAILKKAFPQGLRGVLAHFPKKEKERLVIAQKLAQHFKAGQAYPEKEIDEILKKVYSDYSLLRRYLVEYGFLERNPEGSRYLRKA